MKKKKHLIKNAFAVHAANRTGAGVHAKTGVAKVRHERRKTKQDLKGYRND